MGSRVTGWLNTYTYRQRLGGPRQRLGVMWFLALLAALGLGSFAIALLFAVVAGIAALQASAAWRAKRVRVNNLVAGAGAALLPLAAWLGNRAIAVVLLGMVIAALLLGTGTKVAGLSVDVAKANLPAASATLRSGLFVGLAAAAVVQVHRVDPMAMLYLMSLVCVFDSGDYLIGSGSTRRFAGPLAGLLGCVVLIVAMSAINPAPLTSDGDVRALGILMAIGCPLGQMLGSWTLPSARAKAPALRRIDSWLVSAPAFLFGLWLIG